MAIKDGDKAPDFSLISFTPSNEPIEYTLSSYNGKKNVILFFFSQAFTGVCKEEMNIVSNDFSDLEDMNAEVFGISVDGTFVQKAFAKENNIKIPLLSDFNKEVIKKYDIVHENFVHGMKNVSKRAVFLIDKEGVVRYMEITENPGVQVNFDKIKEALKSLS